MNLIRYPLNRRTFWQLHATRQYLHEANQLRLAQQQEPAKINHRDKSSVETKLHRAKAIEPVPEPELKFQFTQNEN